MEGYKVIAQIEKREHGINTDESLERGITYKQDDREKTMEETDRVRSERK